MSYVMFNDKLKEILTAKKRRDVFIQVSPRALTQMRETYEVISDGIMGDRIALTVDESRDLTYEITSFSVEDFPGIIDRGLLNPITESKHREQLTLLRNTKYCIPKAYRGFLKVLIDVITETKGFYV